MKQKLSLFFIAFSTFIYAQTSEELKELDYVGHKVRVPESCIVKSETEIMCNGTSTQWRYLENEMKGMGETITEQLVNQFQNAPDFINKTEVKMSSFGSELNGYKFQFLRDDKDIYFIALTGTVNDKSLIMYIGTMKDIKETSDLNELQNQIISFE